MYYTVHVVEHGTNRKIRVDTFAESAHEAEQQAAKRGRVMKIERHDPERGDK